MCRTRRKNGDALLVGATDFGRSVGQTHIGDSRQSDGFVRAGIHDEAAYFVDRRIACIDAAHQHVDFLVAPAVARCDVAADAGDDAIGDVAHREAQLRGSFLVEHDLDLGMAAFYR